MKINLNHKYRSLLFTLPVVVILQVLFTSRALAQIDYFSDQKTNGLRIGVGEGLTALRSVYDITPLKPAYIASIDYCFTPYFNIGFEGQDGTIMGVDNHNYYLYSESSDLYLSGTVNVRLGVGYFLDFQPNNKFMDAVKRAYIGAGAGYLRTDITLTYSGNEYGAIYGEPVTKQTVPDFDFEMGTYIDLRNVLGRDNFELNPKLQFSYLPTRTFDGFISRASSTLRGVYDIASVSVRYKF